MGEGRGAEPEGEGLGSGTESEGETGTWGRADRPQRSGVGGRASPVPAWRGAGQEVWTGRSTALGGVQSCAGLFYFFSISLEITRAGYKGTWVPGPLAVTTDPWSAFLNLGCDMKPIG